MALAGAARLRARRTHPDADRLRRCPPALLEPGERTGRCRRGTDTLLTAADGRSWISVEDLAVAVLDEVEDPGRERLVTVVHAAGPAPVAESSWGAGRGTPLGSFVWTRPGQERNPVKGAPHTPSRQWGSLTGRRRAAWRSHGDRRRRGVGVPQLEEPGGTVPDPASPA
ncbi:hypothetical protein ACE1SV_06820 [Streptomyces sennicomposti]